MCSKCHLPFLGFPAKLLTSYGMHMIKVNIHFLLKNHMFVVL